MDMSTLGAQLRCPSGAFAQEISDRMYASNLNMIQKTYQQLPLKKAQHLLELGFGNARHIKALLKAYPSLQYTGVDISPDMVQMAQNFIDEEGLNQAQVMTISGSLSSLPKAHWDACFTVNTLYFLPNPMQTFEEILSCLKPEGIFAMGSIQQEFGRQLPFTQEHFTFYEENAIIDMLKKSGFRDIQVLHYTEQTLAKDGLWVERPFEVYVGQK
jgi:SAM-dependent methyltransferase